MELITFSLTHNDQKNLLKLQFSTSRIKKETDGYITILWVDKSHCFNLCFFQRMHTLPFFLSRC